MSLRWTKPLVVLVPVVLIAACSSGAGGPAGPGSGGSAAATAPGAPAASVVEGSTGGGTGASDAGDGGTTVVDVCRLVTAADVAKVFPGSVTAAVEPTNPSGCSYVFAPEDQGLTIEVVAGDQAQTFWTGNTGPQGSDTIAVSGIGDQAMREPGNPDLVAIKGSTFCEVEENGAPELYQGMATPDPNDKISDDEANTIAQKFGSFCNLVFAAQ
jgi:hypothetical protein